MIDFNDQSPLTREVVEMYDGVHEKIYIGEYRKYKESVYRIETPQFWIYVDATLFKEVFILDWADGKDTLVDECTVSRFHHLMIGLGAKLKDNK